MARLSVFLARVVCLAVFMWSSVALADDQQPSASELARTLHRRRRVGPPERVSAVSHAADGSGPQPASGHVA